MVPVARFYDHKRAGGQRREKDETKLMPLPVFDHVLRKLIEDHAQEGGDKSIPKPDKEHLLFRMYPTLCSGIVWGDWRAVPEFHALEISDIKSWEFYQQTVTD